MVLGSFGHAAEGLVEKALAGLQKDFRHYSHAEQQLRSFALGVIPAIKRFRQPHRSRVCNLSKAGPRTSTSVDSRPLWVRNSMIRHPSPLAVLPLAVLWVRRSTARAHC